MFDIKAVVKTLESQVDTLIAERNRNLDGITTGKGGDFQLAKDLDTAAVYLRGAVKKTKAMLAKTQTVKA